MDVKQAIKGVPNARKQAKQALQTAVTTPLTLTTLDATPELDMDTLITAIESIHTALEQHQSILQQFWEVCAGKE